MAKGRIKLKEMLEVLDKVDKQITKAIKRTAKFPPLKPLIHRDYLPKSSLDKRKKDAQMKLTVTAIAIQPKKSAVRQRAKKRKQ